MSLCINPQCPKPENSEQMLFCQGCGSGLLLAEKYRVTKLMSAKGGFENTYEIVEEWVPKVLKVLDSDNPGTIELFKREFRVLNKIAEEHITGIPHVEDLFLYKPNGYKQVLHCLVMERINGMDLAGYIKTINRSIDEKTAIGWLAQLTQILEQIHIREIFHGNIKPSNIILQPNGKLVLTDFATVNEAVPLKQQAKGIYPPGYVPPARQKPGQSPAGEDLCALGQTFVYLLTKIEPIELYDPAQNILVWHDRTTDISPSFLDNIDRLMGVASSQRSDNIKNTSRKITLLNPTSTQPKPIDPSTISNSNPIVTPNQAPIPTPIPTSIPAPIENNPPQPSQTIRSDDSERRSSPFSPKSNVSLIAKISIPLAILLAALVAWLLWDKLHQAGETASGTGGAFNEIKDVPTGTFRFGGSTTWATTRQPTVAIDSVIKGAFPGYNIQYTDANSPNANIRSISTGKCDKNLGSNTGICWLIQGDLDFAQSSVSLEKSKYADVFAVSHLKEEAVGYDALTIVVNRQLNLPGLTVEQVRGIYTGKITNWSQVNGPNVPIAAFSIAESSGIFSSFKDLVLQKGDELKATIVTSNSEGLQKLKSNPGAVYYGSAKEVIVDSCLTQPIPIGKTVNTIKPYQEPLQPVDACLAGERNKINTEVIKNQIYPLTRKIYVVIKADGSSSQKAGEAYAKLLKTKQGQDLLERAGFVSIAN